MRTTAVMVLSAVVLSACADTQGTPARLSAMHDTVDGVPRMMYPAAGEAELGWRMDTLAVVGDILGDDPDYQFDGVTPQGVAGDAAGNVWLLDATGHRVVGYDSAGSFIASYGRQGEGPGEINMAFGMSAGPGDTLWVMEMMGRRLTGFPARGGEPRVVPFGVDLVPAPPMVMEKEYLLANLLHIFRPGDGEEERPREFVLARFDPAGVLADTVYAAPMPKQDVVQIESGNRRMMLMTTPQFAPTLRWAAFSDGGVAAVRDDQYSIRLLNPDGSERLRIERDAPPRPVTEADREEVRSQMQGQRTRFFGGGDPALQDELARRQLEAMTFAATVPRIERIAIDPQDRLWVLASPDEAGGDGRIDVYDRDGALLGSLRGMELPTRFLENGRAVYLGKDEDTDVQQVTLVRVVDAGVVGMGE